MRTVGEEAPKFRGPDQHGREIVLEQLLGNGDVILFFYPKAFTRICTLEVRLFQESAAALTAQGATLIGVSPDPAETVRRFAEQYAVEFPLLADPNQEIARAYGTVFLGVWQRRVTFVIGQDGRVRAVYKDEFGAQRHVSAVRQALGDAPPPAESVSPSATL